MIHHTKLAVFLTVETALFVFASLVHAGVLVSGFEHARAMTAERVIGAVLALGLVLFWVWPARAVALALVVQAFALLGRLVGAFTIAVGGGAADAGRCSTRFC